MGIMHLRKTFWWHKNRLERTHKYTLVLSWNWQNILQRTMQSSKNTAHTLAYKNRFPYLGLAAGKHWEGQSCSARHWQPCQHSVLSGHHVHCRSGRSPRGRCPSDCSPPGPWMSMCYMGARREEREMLINCHITFSNMLSVILLSVMVCDELSVFPFVPFYVLSPNSLPFYAIHFREFKTDEQ